MLGDQVVGKRLQRVEGVARVDISGLTVREVRIDLDPQRLRAYGVTPAEIATALNEANADQPVGLLSDTDAGRAAARGRPRARPAPVRAAGGGAPRHGLALTLGDLGRLVEREREPDSQARINGQRAIIFNVFKQQDANIVGDRRRREGGDGRAAQDTCRPMSSCASSTPAATGSRARSTGLQNTLIEGALLTVAIVFLFLHSWRSTIITGLTLPIAVISSFIAVYAFGFTLNFMTMMALSLCIGLLIDDAIVVRENIVRHVGDGQGPPPRRLRRHRRDRPGGDGHHLRHLRGVRAGGLHGRHHRQVLLPLRHHRGGGGAGEPVRQLHARPDAVQRLEGPAVDDGCKRLPVIGHAIRATDRAMDVLHAVYERVIHWAFSGRRYRVFFPPLPAYGRGFGADGQRDKASPRRCAGPRITPRGLVMAVGAGSFVAALGLAPLVGSEFVPQTDQSYTQLQLRMPVGSSLERSNAKVQQVEEIVLACPRSRPSPPGSAAPASATRPG